MEKNFAYIHLREEMKNRKCPICALIEKNTDQSIKTYLYECVMDPKLHERIVKMRGFCASHSRRFTENGDPLAHAIIYKDILHKAKKDISRRDFAEYTEHSECIFCKEERDNEKFYVSGFADAYEDADFRKQYQDEGLLCIHHLGKIYEAAPKIYPEIEKDTLRKYEHLMDNLEEIQRKSDYRFTDEPWTDEEKVAWKVASATVGSGVEGRSERKEGEIKDKKRIFGKG